MLRVDRGGDRRSWAILAQSFSGSSPETLTAVAGAVGKVKIPLRLRDFQVLWESPAFGLFHGTAFSTALVLTAGTESRKIHRRRTS
jgi:hypothetical protein